jgi:hypothetical protein
MQAPHNTLLVGGEVFETQVAAADRLNDGGVTKGILPSGPASDCFVANDPAGPYDAGAAAIESIDETNVAWDPFPFPAELAYGVIGEVGGSRNRGVFGET